LLLFTFACFALNAHAQWGVGLSGGTTCPYQYGPGGGAINGGDELANLQGRYNMDQQRMQQLQGRLESLNTQLEQDRQDMGTVLNGRVVDSIVEHRRYQRNVADYQDCNWDHRTASGGSSTTNTVLPGGFANPGGSVNPNLTPPPADFCYAPSQRNAWDK